MEWREKGRQWSLVGLFLLALCLKFRNWISWGSDGDGSQISLWGTKQQPEPARTRNNYNNYRGGVSRNRTSPALLDFFIIGFPKSGAGALATALRAHESVIMPRDDDPNRQYAISTAATDEAAVEELEEVFSEELDRMKITLLEQDLQRGLVDTREIYTLNGVRRLFWKRAPTRLLVTLRHPVWLFESYFNYRVAAQWYRKHADAEPPKIPNPLELTGDESWKGVGLRYLLLERFLAPLLQQDGRPKMDMFVLFQDELSDANETRTESLRAQLQEFLGLPGEIRPFDWAESNNHFTYNETLFICRDEYSDLRFLIMENAAKTSLWMREHLVDAVRHSEGDFFGQLVDGLRKDPCLARI